MSEGLLLKITNPIGVIKFYFPYLYGSLLASSLAEYRPGLFRILTGNLRLLIFSFLLRATVCTWSYIVRAREYDDPDDTADRGTDTERNSLPPSIGELLALLSGLAMLVFVCFRTMLPSMCSTIAVPFLILYASFPFVNAFGYRLRPTLALAHGCGAFMGFPAVGEGAQLLTWRHGSTKGWGTALGLAFLIVTYSFLLDMVYCISAEGDGGFQPADVDVVERPEQDMHIVRICIAFGVVFLVMVPFAQPDLPIWEAVCVVFTTLAVSAGILFMGKDIDFGDPVVGDWWINQGTIRIGLAAAIFFIGFHLRQS